MPHSMTGFSTAEETIPPFRVVWEIRSVNHRFLELAFRMPGRAALDRGGMQGPDRRVREPRESGLHAQDRGR